MSMISAFLSHHVALAMSVGLGGRRGGVGGERNAVVGSFRVTKSSASSPQSLELILHCSFLLKAGGTLGLKKVSAVYLNFELGLSALHFYLALCPDEPLIAWLIKSRP